MKWGSILRALNPSTVKQAQSSALKNSKFKQSVMYLWNPLISAALRLFMSDSEMHNPPALQLLHIRSASLLIEIYSSTNYQFDTSF